MAAAHWKLPGYVIECCLGAGATGDVWRARVGASGDLVALKRIRLAAGTTPTDAHREAALLVALDHPHLVRLHDLVRTPEGVVLVLDLAEGGSLADLLERRHRLSIGEVVTALSPIGAALAYAHGNGVVHGDLTPGNVVFTRDGRPLLADLGVGRIIGDDDSVRTTPAFADPLVAAGAIPGPASDVFMLGAVAYAALTGQPVWTGDHPDAVLARAVSGDLTAVQAWTAALPTGIGEVLGRALSADPLRRGTAADFALDLRHAAEPTRIEVTAGRAAVPRAEGRYVGVHRAAAPRPLAEQQITALSSRPASPANGAHDSAARTGLNAQFTHAVRSAVRPTLPPRRRIRLIRLARSRRTWLAVGTATAIAATALGLGAAAPGRTASPSSTSVARTVLDRPSVTPASTAPPSAIPAAGIPASTSPAVDAAHVLSTLDARRVQAFAENHPDLLAAVYPPGPLLAQDQATLRRLVPLGCGLHGAVTSYAQVSASARSGGGLIVRTLATLSAGTLACHGVVRSVTPAQGPTGLRIELQPGADGYRIARQQLAL